MAHEKETACAVAESLVIPRINGIEQSLGAGREKFIDHDIRLQAIALRHDEHHRRITLLEGWMAEQQAENRGIHRDIQGLQAAVGGIADGLTTLTAEVRSDRADRKAEQSAMFGQIKAFFTEKAVEATQASEREAKRTQEALSRHGTLMKIGMTVAFSVAGLVAVLGALHGVFAQIPLVETITLMLARLGL